MLTLPGQPDTGTGRLSAIGRWMPDSSSVVGFAPGDVAAIAQRPRLPVHVVLDSRDGRVGVAVGGSTIPGSPTGRGTLQLLASLPPVYPEWLGDRSFCEVHGVRFPYVCGEMANGIASARMVAAIAGAQMLGFFGAAGLPATRVADTVGELAASLGPARAWGVNIIHSPGDSAREEWTADLLIRNRVPCVSASAFMGLTPAIIRCAAAGITADASGRIVRARRVFAKVSRAEIAEQFMSPPPADVLGSLVARGLITHREAQLAGLVPVAEDITVEADSGGHTDNRPLSVLLPVVLQLRAQAAARNGSCPRIRIGAAGGLGDPGAVAAAFALGADYVLTGSVNQAAVESGLSCDAKTLLADADFADVAMAPSADMFELGVKVQVLKRGTMYAARAGRLYDLYLRHESLEAIPPETASRLEREIFRMPLERAWQETRAFWSEHSPSELALAESSPKRRMALTFRWYLGLSSRWAIDGATDRRGDYQLWCGPAIGTFNRWAAGSFLADPAQRSVVQIARNLLEGAAVLTRAHQLRTHGADVGLSAFQFTPSILD
jgi:trans-AT polyketide synthase/acyltransferase/oxidoreductase domain-containing protein